MESDNEEESNREEESKPKSKELTDSNYITDEEVGGLYTHRELTAAKVFILLITIGLGIIVVGGVWAIKDIFSTNVFGDFLNLSAYTKILIVGVIVFALFILLIFLVVIYRHGRKSILRSVFEKKIQRKEQEVYLPARIISFGTLISIVGIIVSCGVFGIQYYMLQTVSSRNDVAKFLSSLTGGVQILFFGIIYMAFVLLALALVYLWNNGYYFIVSKILHRNEKIVSPVEYTVTQKNVSRVFFIILVASILVIILGVVWAIADIVQPTNKFQDFIDTALGIEFLTISVIALGVFILLIIAMTVYKSGNLWVSRMLFYRIPTPTNNKEYPTAKLLAFGIIAALFLILFAVIAWVISESMTIMSNSTESSLSTQGTFFEKILDLSGGIRFILFGFLFAVIIMIILGINYFAHNSYILMVNRILKTQKTIENKLDES